MLVACNVMEAAGTGFEKIMEDYKNADDLHKPYIYSTSDHFTLVLPDLTYDKGVEDEMVPSLSYIPVPNETKLDSKVLSYCYYKAHKVSEIVKYLHISDSSYFRELVLKNLVKHGYLFVSKISNATYYKTNPNMVNKE